MSNSPVIKTLYMDWEDGESKDGVNNQLSRSSSVSENIKKESTDICGAYEVIMVDIGADRSDSPSVENRTNEILSPLECISVVKGKKKKKNKTVSKVVKKEMLKSKSKSDKIVRRKNISVNKTSSTEVIAKNKISRKSANHVPSVYSCSEIKRHKTRLELKALEENTDTDSDNNMGDGDDELDLDPDLDINLRIFEESAKSIENVIIGEIQCGVMDDKSNTEQTVKKTNNKNTNVFKLSVNANFTESNEQKNETVNNDENSAAEKEEADILSDLSSDYLFSDDDSDLDILTSKPIVRKRAAQPIKKEKKKEKSSESDKKLTMYDLIYDTVLPSPRNKEECSDDEQKSDTEKKDPKKLKSIEEKKSKKIKSVDEKKDMKKSKPTEEKTKVKESEVIVGDEELESLKVEIKTDTDSLPVPQLKVGADGQVIIDMDSLVIEQTGLAKARNAIANSEIIEECELNYTSYNKKCGYRKQWSPHDTLKFYDVLSAIGTDFTLMATLFPGRTRNCMKRKFKREEKTNADLILKALTCKQKFDIGLLEKELKKKEEMVKILKKNSMKEVKQQKSKSENKGTKKETAKCKRKSFFERGISCFQNS